MPNRRILSLWFPRLGAERLLRRDGGRLDMALAVVADEGNRQVLSSVSGQAAAAGLAVGMALRDATAICPALVTRARDIHAEADFLAALRRWAGKFSPWVAQEEPDGLVIDLTGCAHLFGGEENLLKQSITELGDLGLTARGGIADTLGAAWALARFGRGDGAGLPQARSGDAIDQEAPATRAKAHKRRHWTRDGAAPSGHEINALPGHIAPPGGTRAAIAALPVTALRLDATATAGLARLGLRRIGDLAGLPRGSLARRFGAQVVTRLDQALGVTPEPISPARAPDHFAVRMSFPDPVGLEADILAALDRLLPPLCDRLRARGRGARRVRLQAARVDAESVAVEVGLARPSHDPDRIRPLLAMKVGELDAGFGIDALRLLAPQTEPVQPRTHAGHAEAAARGTRSRDRAAGLDDLIGRLGARIGLEQITRLHPADSHIPEKTATAFGAAWAEPAMDWSPPPAPRPLLIWPPEPVMAEDDPMPPTEFRWRGQAHALAEARGPERIAPEWWLDDPAWRSGVRDYWQVTTEAGARLWLYYAHGAEASPGWFAQGSFA